MSENNETETMNDTDDSNRRKEDFEEFVNEVKDESDRAAVILGASKLDQLLGILLEAYLLPCPNMTDSLFSNNGLLGTFSSKIDLCYRLGIIDAQFSKSIHLTRRIRNTFAYEVCGAKLNNGSHKDCVKALTSPFKDSKWRSFG